jgi:hypothetical protein
MRKFLSRLLQSTSKLSATNGLSPPPDLGLIAEHAEKIEEGVPDESERFAKLQEQVEYLLEEVGQENRFRTELSEYVEDLKAEARFIRSARWVFGIISVVTALALLVTPLVLLYRPSPVFQGLETYPKAALLVGMIAGGVVLLLTLTRSVYRSAHERHSDEFIPPQIKLIHELTKGVTG